MRTSPIPLFVAHNGLEGSELLRSDKVPKDRRLVLLDLNMPKMNGIEFLRELRADPAAAVARRSSCSRPRTTIATRSRRTT